MHPRLLETLRDAQRFGFFGPGSVEDAAAHALGFVDAITDVPRGSRLIDLGSGGGLPGLVIADARPDLLISLLDRRSKRTDFLDRAVRRLGWRHVDVRSCDAREITAGVAADSIEPFDAVTARGFGPPEFTLRTAVAISHHRSVVVISEPPAADRWEPGLLSELGVQGERRGSVRRFTRSM